LLDEPIDDGRDAELSYPTAAFRDRMPSHRRRLVRAREQLLAERGPVRLQVLRQLIHRHPIDAGAALVLPHPFQRGLQVRAFARALHQVARSRALVSVRRRRRFRAPIRLRGFTPLVDRELELPRHLRPFASETHVRFALLSVRPFVVVPRGYYGLG